MEKNKNHRPFAEVAGDARAVFTPSQLTGALNHLLRQQIAPAQPQSSDSPACTDSTTASLAEVAVDAVGEILMQTESNRLALAGKLSRLYQRFTGVYSRAGIPVELRKRQYIARHGLVMSPDNCTTSILDVYRVRAFTRAVDKALARLRANGAHNEPLHLVYPACGPYAPLLLPLLAYYREQGPYAPSDLQVTLIDMQQGAVMSLRAMVDALGIAEYVKGIHCQDAMEFRKDGPVHMVVLEAMQHGFSREGQLPMARHFAAMLEPEGLFIPQEVSVRAVLNSGQREYVEQWQGVERCEAEQMSRQALTKRVDLGEIFSVTPQALRNLSVQVIDETTSLVECGSVEIPGQLTQADRQLLLLCSEVRVFDDEWLREYDSGITHPLPDEQVCIDFTPSQPRTGDLLVGRGDRLTFYYRLNGLPGFFSVCDNRQGGAG